MALAIGPTRAAVRQWESLGRRLASLRAAVEEAESELAGLRRAYGEAVEVSADLAPSPALPARGSVINVRRLSCRESRVAVLVASGKTNQQIADALHVSVNTIKSQVTSVLQKLGLHSRWQVSAALNAAAEPRRMADLLPPVSESARADGGFSFPG